MMGVQRFLMDGLRGFPGFDGLPFGPGPFRPLPAGAFPPGFAPALAGLPPGPGRPPFAEAGFLRGLLPAGCEASDDESRMASNSRSEERRVGKECRSRWS